MQGQTISRTKMVGCLFLATSALVVGSGCVVSTPVAVFPAPEYGSGIQISFYNKAGQSITDDGLLIVHRSYEIPIGFFSPNMCDLGVSNKVVEIRKGKARLPDQWALASLWIVPFLLYPMPAVLPGHNLKIIPLIPGYNYCTGTYQPYEPRAVAISWHEHEQVDDGKVRLLDSDGHESRGIDYLEKSTRPYIRRRHEKRTMDRGPDLCLSNEDYEKVTTFIEKELKRLRAMQSPQTQPATLPWED